MIAEDIYGDYRDTGATSAATAMVSGLAAYFLRLSENSDMNIDVSTPKLMREFMLNKAWGRESDDLKAIWNGLTEKELPEGKDDILDYCPIPRRLREDETEPRPKFLVFAPPSNSFVSDRRGLRKRQEEGVEEEEENLTDDIGMCDLDEGGEEEDDEGQDGDGEDEDNEDSGDDKDDDEEESDEEPELPELCSNLSCPLSE